LDKPRRGCQSTFFNDIFRKGKFFKRSWLYFDTTRPIGLADERKIGYCRGMAEHRPKVLYEELVLHARINAEKPCQGHDSSEISYEPGVPAP
jgi:hypothetical protein